MYKINTDIVCCDAVTYILVLSLPGFKTICFVIVCVTQNPALDMSSSKNFVYGWLEPSLQYLIIDAFILRKNWI